MEVTVTQAAALLSKSERTIQRYIKEGRLKSRQLPGHRTVVNVEDLETLRGEMVDIEGILAHLESLQAEVDTLKQTVKELQSRLEAPRSSSGRKTSPLKTPPARILRETVPARQFAKDHGFTRDQMRGWIERGEIDATPQSYGSKTQYVLTKEQQAKAVAFWQSLEGSE